MTAPELLSDLIEAFPRQPVGPGTVRVYLRELGDLPELALTDAVCGLIRTSEWFPTISAIRNATAERMLGLPDEGEALAQVEARIAWARGGGIDKDATSVMHPAVVDAVHAVGGFFSFRSAENPGVVRGQFLKLYRERRAAQVRKLTIGAPTRAVLLAEYPAAHEN